jgi:hypothetical protein
MNITLILFFIAIAISSTAAVLIARRSSKNEAWLDQIESKRSVNPRDLPDNP